jgi:hypothetical protein
MDHLHVSVSSPSSQVSQLSHLTAPGCIIPAAPHGCDKTCACVECHNPSPAPLSNPLLLPSAGPKAAVARKPTVEVKAFEEAAETDEQIADRCMH